MSKTPPLRRAGFTLMELLVVIGIIALLMGILLPTISVIKAKGFETDTRNQLTRLAGAIEHYCQQLGNYPGLLRNDQVGPGTPAPVLPQMDNTTVSLQDEASNDLSGISATENLYLSLVGGLETTFSTTTPPVLTSLKFSDARLRASGGSRSLNPYKPGSFPAYFDASKDFSAGKWGAQDTAIPELLDRFPVAKPIIYMRASRGATGGIIGTDDPANSTYYLYNRGHYEQYATFSSSPDGYADDTAYFTNPALAGVARNPDGFLLISPGRDGKYFTKDDIIAP